MALAVVSQLIANADRFLLELFGVARAEIGFWGAAGTIVWARAALPQLISVALYPSFSRQAEAGASARRAGLLAGLGGVEWYVRQQSGFSLNPWYVSLSAPRSF